MFRVTTMDAIIMQVYILLMVYTVVFGVLVVRFYFSWRTIWLGSEWTTHNPVWVQDDTRPVCESAVLHVPYFVVGIVCVIMQKPEYQRLLLYASTILVIVAQEYFEALWLSNPIKSINLLELAFDVIDTLCNESRKMNDAF
jgi:hypothetical protein